MSTPGAVTRCVVSRSEDGAESVVRASPKSSTFTNPSARSMMFSGFTSRCIRPAACAAASARAVWLPTSTTVESGIGGSPGASIDRSVRPSISSWTMKCSPSAVSPTS